MAKDFGRDYGIRPTLFKNYPDMMRTVSKKAVFDVRVEPDSEFEKPYLTDDYNTQQQIHQLNFAVPYLPAAMLGVDATNPMGALVEDIRGDQLLDAKGLIDGVKYDFPVALYNQEVGLWMDGYGRNGEPWKQSEIYWKILEPAHGRMFNRQTYVADDITATEDIIDNIQGIAPDGHFSNIVITTKPPVYELRFYSGQCAGYSWYNYTAIPYERLLRYVSGLYMTRGIPHGSIVTTSHPTYGTNASTVNILPGNFGGVSMYIGGQPTLLDTFTGSRVFFTNAEARGYFDTVVNAVTVSQLQFPDGRIYRGVVNSLPDSSIAITLNSY